MKKALSFLLICLSLIILLNSCSAVYVDIEKPEVSHAVEVNLEGEYFTDGRLYTPAGFYSDDGFIYEGVWYFVENREYFTGEVTIDAEGHTHTKTGNEFCKRIVKMNAETGTISSPCLDPVCTHGPGSNCPLMEIEGLNMHLRMVADDWIIIEHYTTADPVYGTFRQVHGYNIKTGKTLELYADCFEDNVFTNYQSTISVFEGKFYIVKHELDYSGTKFNPKGSKPLSDYEPVTKSYLYEYDLDKNKVKELFEIPDGATVIRMTNKRFMLRIGEELYTCNLDGSNLQTSDGLKFFPLHKIGTLSFGYLDNGFRLYDLKTNQTTYVNIDEITFDSMKDVKITENGVYMHLCTSEEEYAAVLEAIREYRKQHRDMAPEELDKKIDELYNWNEARYGGNAQIWRCGHDGNDLELLINIENAVARFVGTTDKYAYIILSKADPNNGYQLFPEYKNQPCCVNLETGEISPLPELELILPENAWHTKEEMLEAIK